MFTCAHISTRQRVIALPPTNCNYRYDFAWPSLHFANSVKQFINFFFFLQLHYSHSLVIQAVVCGFQMPFYLGVKQKY